MNFKVIVSSTEKFIVRATPHFIAEMIYREIELIYKQVYGKNCTVTSIQTYDGFVIPSTFLLRDLLNNNDVIIANVTTVEKEIDRDKTGEMESANLSFRYKTIEYKEKNDDTDIHSSSDDEIVLLKDTMGQELPKIKYKNEFTCLKDLKNTSKKPNSCGFSMDANSKSAFTSVVETHASMHDSHSSSAASKMGTARKLTLPKIDSMHGDKKQMPSQRQLLVKTTKEAKAKFCKIKSKKKDEDPFASLNL